MTSTIKVDNIQDQDGNNIINENANTITIGKSGDTVTLASGASQSGFSRTGTVDWDTTAKTASFTAVSGNGYFVNTTSGAVTMTLPATPSAGDIVAFKDYAGTFATNNLTIGRNGSNLDGTAGDKAIDTDHTSMSLVYVDGTQGWKSVEEGTGFIGESFIVASGGTETTCGNCKIHTFTGPGTFTVCAIATCSANNVVSYAVVAGGAGGGAQEGGGGGGAGGFREVKTPVTPYIASPKCGYSTPGNRITVTATAFPITVGAGGAAPPGGKGACGGVSTFSTITSAGGGGGGAGGNRPGNPGGSGGGGAGRNTEPGGLGNQPPVTPAQGSNGGNARPGCSPTTDVAGGGGGATANGGNASTGGPAGPGGAGATTNISGSPTGYAGGGGGGTETGSAGTASDGGGAGAAGPTGATAATANTGGGGGGAGNGAAAAGGSGIVIIRYKYQ